MVMLLMMPGCGKKPLASALPDQLQWQSKNLHLIFAINGVPIDMHVGHDSDSGFLNVQPLEKSGKNTLEVIGIGADATKDTFGSIRIHAYHDEGMQAVEIKMTSPAAANEQRYASQFAPVGVPDWAYGDADEIKELSPTDEDDVLTLVTNYIAIIRRHDVDGALSFCTTSSAIAARAQGMSIADAEKLNRQVIGDAFRNLTK